MKSMTSYKTPVAAAAVEFSLSSLGESYYLARSAKVAERAICC